MQCLPLFFFLLHYVFINTVFLEAFMAPLDCQRPYLAIQGCHKRVKKRKKKKATLAIF